MAPCNSGSSGPRASTRSMTSDTSSKSRRKLWALEHKVDRVVQFMGDARRQLTNAGEFLVLDELVLATFSS